MADFIVVVMSLVGIGFVAWFVSQNDEPGNTRPDKTILAMAPDPLSTAAAPRARFATTAGKRRG